MTHKLTRARLILDAHAQGYTEIADGHDFIMITAASLMWARMVVANGGRNENR